MGEMWRAVRTEVRAHRAEMLDKANTEGWTKLSDYHFRRTFNGKRVDWWPSGGKAQIDGKMIYGHRNVKTALAALATPTKDKPRE